MIFTSLQAFAFSSLKLLLLPLALSSSAKTAPLQGRSVAGGDLLIAPGRVLLAHILFRAIPDAPVADENAIAALASNSSATGISMQLAPIYGISIPLIVRHGKTSATVTMNDLRLSTSADGSHVLTGHLSRTGNQSEYGDIRVSYLPSGGAIQQIGSLSGVAIYSPNSERNFGIRLILPNKLKLQGGTIKVQYRRPLADGGKTIAEGSITGF